MPEPPKEWFTFHGVRTPEQEESIEIHIARDYMNSWHDSGSFLHFFFMALQKADPVNFELLRTAAISLIRKYNLQCTCSNTERGKERTG